jgi:hypothetical protein
MYLFFNTHTEMICIPIQAVPPRISELGLGELISVRSHTFQFVERKRDSMRFNLIPFSEIPAGVFVPELSALTD